MSVTPGRDLERILREGEGRPALPCARHESRQDHAGPGHAGEGERAVRDEVRGRSIALLRPPGLDVGGGR